jgi:hypothetical protein
MFLFSNVYLVKPNFMGEVFCMKIRGSSEFESTTGQIKKNELTGNNMIDCSMRVGDPI